MCLRSPPVEAPHCHCTLLAPTACYCRLFSLSLSLQAGVWLPRSNTPINISMLCYSPHTAHACSRGTFTHYFILVLGRFEAWISAFSKCSFSILTPEELRFKRPWAFMSYLILYGSIIQNLNFWTPFICRKHIWTQYCPNNTSRPTAYTWSQAASLWKRVLWLNINWSSFLYKADWCPGKLLGLFISLTLPFFFIYQSPHVLN